MKEILFDHEKISAIGLGTTGFWNGTNAGLEECIQTAHARYGINLFDTAEMYGDGKCETALARALRGIRREEIFIVDKILPDNAVPEEFDRCLDASLRRLETDYIDLYLLHWRENADLAFVTEKMHEAQRQGKIRRWGVSNFDIRDLTDLFAANGTDCFCNQIFYCLYERGAELDLLPFMKEHGILPMSYSSLGSGYCPHPDLQKNRAIMRACRSHGIEPEAFMLKMNTELGFATLFSTSSLSHLEADLQEIPAAVYEELLPVFDREYPAPDHPVPLVKI